MSYIEILYSIAFLDLLAVGMIVPLIPAHVRQMDGSHLVVGALGSVYAGFQLICGPLIGSLSDIKGCKTVMIYSLLATSAAYLFIGLTNSIIAILLMRATLGVFKQTQMLTKAITADYEKNQQKQSEIYGKMAAISGAGMTLGPSISGHFAEGFPENGFMIVAGIVSAIFILNAGLALLLPNVKPVRKQTNRSENILQNAKSSLKQSIVQLYQIQWSKYWDVFFLKGLMGFAMGVYFSHYGLYLESEYGLSKMYIGYMISFLGVIGTLSSYFISYINSLYHDDEDFSLRNCHVFAILTIALAGLISSFNIYVYAFWLIPLAIGNAVGRLTSLEIVLRRSHGKHKGTLIGASNSVRSLSGVVSPMASGFIGHYIGINYVNYASLLATSVGLVISYRNRGKKLKDD